MTGCAQIFFTFKEVTLVIRLRFRGRPLTSSSASSSVLYGANPTLIQPPIRVYAHPVGERFRVIIPIGGKDAVGVGYAQASMEAPRPESGVRVQMMGIIL